MNISRSSTDHYRRHILTIENWADDTVRFVQIDDDRLAQRLRNSETKQDSGI